MRRVGYKHPHCRYADWESDAHPLDRQIEIEIPLNLAKMDMQFVEKFQQKQAMSNLLRQICENRF